MEVKGFTGTITYLHFRKNSEMLDMRYKVNREFAKTLHTRRIEVRPDCPPGMMYFMNDKFVQLSPRRFGKLSGIGPV